MIHPAGWWLARIKSEETAAAGKVASPTSGRRERDHISNDIEPEWDACSLPCHREADCKNLVQVMWYEPITARPTRRRVGGGRRRMEDGRWKEGLSHKRTHPRPPHLSKWIRSMTYLREPQVCMRVRDLIADSPRSWDRLLYSGIKRASYLFIYWSSSSQREREREIKMKDKWCWENSGSDVGSGKANLDQEVGKKSRRKDYQIVRIAVGLVLHPEWRRDTRAWPFLQLCW